MINMKYEMIYKITIETEKMAGLPSDEDIERIINSWYKTLYQGECHFTIQCEFEELKMKVTP